MVAAGNLTVCDVRAAEGDTKDLRPADPAKTARGGVRRFYAPADCNILYTPPFGYEEAPFPEGREP